MTFPFPFVRTKRPRGIPAFSATPVDTRTIAASQSVYTFAGVNFGDRHDYGQVLVCYGHRASSGLNDLVLGSSSIAGKVPTLICANAWEVIGVGAMIVDYWGASGDITLTFPKAQASGCSILVYRLVNFRPGPSVGVASGISSSNGSDTTLNPTDIAVANGALAIGVAARANSSFSPTWNNGLTQASNILVGAGNMRMSVAFQLVTPAATKNYTVGTGSGAANAMAIGSINP